MIVQLLHHSISSKRLTILFVGVISKVYKGSVGIPGGVFMGILSQKMPARKQRSEKGLLAGGEGVIFGERAPVVMIKNQ